MNSLLIAIKDLRVMLRDRTALLMLFATPLILIILLGMALGPVFEQDSTMEPAVLGVVDKAEMEGLPIPAISDIFAEMELGEYLEVTGFETEEEALQALGKGELAAALIVPSDFGQRLMAGEPVDLELKRDPGSTLGAAVASTVVRRLVSSWNVYQTAARVAFEQGAADFSALQQGQPGQRDWAQLKKRSVGENTKRPSALEYYAVSMSVMYLLFAANTASTFFLAERADGTLNRMLAFPITRLQVILGKLGGVVVLGVGQLALLFGFSHFVYDVDFGSSPLGFALMIVASVVAAMGVGAVISAVGRDPEVADQLGVIVILVMSMVGGCMLPSYLFPSWMNKLSFLTFNRWSIEGFFTIMFRGGTVQDVWLHAAVLFGMGLAALAVAVPLTRFERS